MPYALKKLNDGYFQVVNTDTGSVKAKHTTFEKGIRQIRLLESLEKIYDPATTKKIHAALGIRGGEKINLKDYYIPGDDLEDEEESD